MIGVANVQSVTASGCCICLWEERQDLNAFAPPRKGLLASLVLEAYTPQDERNNAAHLEDAAAEEQSGEFRLWSSESAGLLSTLICLKEAAMRITKAIKVRALMTMAAIGLAGGLLGQSAAQGGGPQGLASGGTTAVVPASASYVGGSSIMQVRIARNGDPQTTSSSKFIDLPGAAVNITVPPRARVLVMARFSGESACYDLQDGKEQHWCSVKLLVNNTEMDAKSGPGSDGEPGKHYAFDSTDAGRETLASWEGHSMDRSLAFSNSTDVVRTFKVRAQWAINDVSPADPHNVQFWLDETALTVEVVAIP